MAGAQDTNAEVTARLDIMIRLLAAIYAREMNNNEAIVSLNTLQLTRDQIAVAVGVTTHNVSQVLYAANKKKAKAGDEGRSLTIEPSAAAEAP